MEENKIYDYEEAVREDVRKAIECDYDLEDYAGEADRLEDDLRDDLFTSWVTGLPSEYNAEGIDRAYNGYGGYTDDETAEECLKGNEELLTLAMQDHGCAPFWAALIEEWENGTASPAELDTAIRCYLLFDAIGMVVYNLEPEGKLDEKDEVEDDEE